MFEEICKYLVSFCRAFQRNNVMSESESEHKSSKDNMIMLAWQPHLPGGNANKVKAFYSKWIVNTGPYQHANLQIILLLCTF